MARDVDILGEDILEPDTSIFVTRQRSIWAQPRVRRRANRRWYESVRVLAKGLLHSKRPTLGGCAAARRFPKNKTKYLRGKFLYNEYEVCFMKRLLFTAILGGAVLLPLAVQAQRGGVSIGGARGSFGGARVSFSAPRSGGGGFAARPGFVRGGSGFAGRPTSLRTFPPQRRVFSNSAFLRSTRFNSFNRFNSPFFGNRFFFPRN